MDLRVHGSKLVVRAAALVLILSANAPARAADYTLKFGTATINDAQHEYGLMYKEALEKATGGRIEVKVFPQGQLGTIAAHIEGLQLGTIEMYMGPADFFAGADPRYGVFSIPLLFKSREHAGRVLADPELNAYILSLGEPKGFVGAAVVPINESDYFARKPIRRLEDFKGLKLRVNATAAERERMKRLGATAVPMGLAEMITSLQSGVIDGTMSGISIFVAFNLNNFSKVITRTEDTMLISFAALSKAWLDKLPADLRRTVVDEARKLQPRAKASADTVEAAMTQKWKERGGEIVRLPAEDLAELRTRFKTIGEDVTKADPALKAFYERILAVTSKY
jgi:TRAP-type C4-dicarboxylate transport system substrate-binding protein